MIVIAKTSFANYPFLSNSRTHFNSNFKKEQKFFKEYDKLFCMLEYAENDNQRTKATNKLIAFFENNASDISVSNYQLGHYYAFGFFDNYYDGTPSNMDRLNALPIDKELAIKYLVKAPEELGYIRLIPDTWLYDFGEAFVLLSGHCAYPTKGTVEYLNKHPELGLNLFDVAYRTRDYCDVSKSCNFTNQSPGAILYLMILAFQLDDSHPLKSQLMPDMSGEEAASLAYQYSLASNSFSAMYYGGLAAVKGDKNGLIIFINTAIDNQHNHYMSVNDNDHRATIKTGLDYLMSTTRIWVWKMQLQEIVNDKFDDICNSISEYCDETHEQLYAEYKAEVAERKKRRRQELWSNIGMALLSTAVNVGNQYVSYQQNSSIGISSNAFNFNQLLDPRLAVIQVNNQYISEYNSFCFYNKKADGSCYSYDEWMAMRVQAVPQIDNIGSSEVVSQNHNNNLNSNTSTSGLCNLCKGTGRISKDTYPAQFGLDKGEKEKCPECGEWFPKSWGHTHVTCPVCHGH